MRINEIHAEMCKLTNELLISYMCSRRNIKIQYFNLHRKNANRKKTLKELNKAIINKNKRIAELERQLEISNKMAVGKMNQIASLYGQAVIYISKED